MISIKYYKKDNEIWLRSVGHAGYAEYGRDIVCSAISTLLQTLAINLENRYENTVCNIDSGYMFIHSFGEKAEEILDILLMGIEAVAEEYPSFVSLTRGCTLQDLTDML